jgi:plasmid stabilization system protein ParE
MPKSNVVFHRLAAREYRSARDWYVERSTEIAKRFHASVDRAVDRIAAQAESFPHLSGS